MSNYIFVAIAFVLIGLAIKFRQEIWTAIFCVLMFCFWLFSKVVGAFDGLNQKWERLWRKR